MAGKRSRTQSHEGDEEDDDQSGSRQYNSPAQSDSPSASKRSRVRRQNGRLHEEDEDEDAEEDEDEEDEEVEADEPVRQPFTFKREGGDEEPVGEDDFQPGAIRRVKLANFITYEHAEFFPGPSLNMVLGPNGTGKSSLVCAICLGLGYPPSVLGRASAFGEFVKHGKDQATVEIELQKRRGMSTNPVVTLRIRREDNTRKFFINKKDSSLKKVQQLNGSFRIQIDNLCQFLPQDKVAEFAGLNPVDLLAKTLQAAAPPEMLQWQEELKKLFAQQKDFQNHLKDDAAHLNRLETRQASLQADVEKLRERQRITHEIERLKTAKTISEYNEARAKYYALRDEERQLTKQIKKLKKQFEPALAGVNAKEAYMNRIAAALEARQTTLKMAEDAADAALGKSDAVLDSVKDIKNKREATEAPYTNKKKEVAEVKRKITELKAAQQRKPQPFNATEWNTKIREQEHRERELQAELRDHKEKTRVCKDIGLEKRNEVQKINKELESLDSLEGQLKNQLKKISPDGAKGLNWIEANSDKFEKPVFGPPMLTCSLKDERYGDLIQSVLQREDFLCFTAQTANDHKTLSHYLFKELSLSVSVRTSLAPYETYGPPRSISREQLKRDFGLDGWATDFIDGPEPVLAMLCGERRLNTTAIGLNDMADDAYQRLTQVQEIGSFAAGKSSYRVTRRREYGAHASNTRVRQVQRGMFWTNQPVDTAERAALTKQCEQAEAEFRQAKQEYESLKNEKTESLNEESQKIKDTLSDLRRSKGELQAAHNKWLALPDKIEAQEELLAQKHQEIQELKRERRNLNQALDETAIKQAKAALSHKKSVAAIRTAYQAVFEATIRLIEAKSDYESLKGQHVDMEAQMKQADADLEALHKTVVTTKSHATECLRITNAVLQKYSQEESTELQQLAQEKGSVDAITGEIRTFEARLAVIEALNPHALVEYERREAEIADLRRSKARHEADFAKLAAQIKELRDKWEPQLDKVVRRINRAFSYNFEQINCAGEVDVHKDEEDFDKWAIEIKVRFRDGETLQILDQHRQSGGERAVSTIFYLMSLQAMAQAPFRVVDEINQGMDPRNERMVHERMVEIACREHTSQYFLITPKLLTDLRYDERMKVHCIASGEHVPSHDERKKMGLAVLDFKKCAETQRKIAARCAYPSPEVADFDEG